MLTLAAGQLAFISLKATQSKLQILINATNWMKCSAQISITHQLQERAKLH